MFDKPIEDENEVLGEVTQEVADQSEESCQSEPLYTLTYNKKEVKMPLSELIINAQKGLNYDKIKDRLDALSVSKDDLSTEFLDFAKAHPEVEVLPQEVKDGLNQGKSLTDAFNEYEIASLKEELSAYKQNLKNMGASAGSLSDAGGCGTQDSFLEEFLKM